MGTQERLRRTLEQNRLKKASEPPEEKPAPKPEEVAHAAAAKPSGKKNARKKNASAAKPEQATSSKPEHHVTFDMSMNVEYEDKHYYRDVAMNRAAAAKAAAAAASADAATPAEETKVADSEPANGATETAPPADADESDDDASDQETGAESQPDAAPSASKKKKKKKKPKKKPSASDAAPSSAAPPAPAPPAVLPSPFGPLTFPVKMPLRTDSYVTQDTIVVEVYCPSLSVRNITTSISTSGRMLKFSVHEVDGTNKTVMDIALPAQAGAVSRISTTQRKAEVRLSLGAPSAANSSVAPRPLPTPSPLSMYSSSSSDSEDFAPLSAHMASSTLEDIGSLFGTSSSPPPPTYQSLLEKMPDEVLEPSSGACGLLNLGNTCFLNSTLQCLGGASEFTRFFLTDAYLKDVNEANPLGMNGKLAEEYAKLMRRMWARPLRPYIAPTTFKSAVGKFRPQFSGHLQHDSQEVLAFLLDGLHEDLNRIRLKPYTSNPDYTGQPDPDLAALCWSTHRLRNDSLVVDLFQGQYKSTVSCVVCAKVSVAFDPFMFLSLPLPQPPTPILVHLQRTDASGAAAVRVKVYLAPDQTLSRDVCNALAAAVPGLRADRVVLMEHEGGRLNAVYRGEDVVGRAGMMYAYETEEEPFEEGSAVVIFTHRAHGSEAWECATCAKANVPLERCERCKDVAYCSPTCQSADHSSHRLACRPRWVSFGQPSVLVARTPAQRTPAALTAAFAKATRRHIVDARVAEWEEKQPVTLTYLEVPIGGEEGGRTVEPNDAGLLWISADWDVREADAVYDYARARDYTSLIDDKPTTAVSLDECIRLSSERELLENDNAWYCPQCKTHQTASKQLQIWKLPEILVVHLKRFAATRSHMISSLAIRSKLGTQVDYPLESLNMAPHLLGAQTEGQEPIYDLFGVSHHFGGTTGGHYTAHGLRRTDEGEDKWFYFDDDRVSEATPEAVKTASAYVLFYRRRKNTA